jgi:hypothetical protein
VWKSKCNASLKIAGSAIKIQREIAKSESRFFGAIRCDVEARIAPEEI